MIRIFNTLFLKGLTLQAVALVTALSVFPAASFTIEPQKKAVIERMVDLMLISSFENSFAIADSLQRADPADPIATLMLLFGIGLRDLDYDVTVDSALFESTYARVTSLTAAWESRHGRSSYSLTLAGFAKSTYSAYQLRGKKYLEGVQTGFRGLDDLELAKKKDPANKDADYFLGLYDYARIDLKKRFPWATFWLPADRERGIRRLEGAAAGAQLAPLAAKLSLIDIYFQTGRTAAALRVLQEMDERFPGSRFVLWARARADENAGEYQKAAGWYQSLKNSYGQSAQGAHNRLVTGYKEAQMLQAAGNVTEAAEVCKELKSGCCDKTGSSCDEMCREIQNLYKRIR